MQQWIQYYTSILYCTSVIWTQHEICSMNSNHKHGHGPVNVHNQLIIMYAAYPCTAVHRYIRIHNLYDYHNLYEDHAHLATVCMKF